MIDIFNAIIPVFVVLLTGFLAGKGNFLGQEAARVINRFVYYIALPCLLFVTTSQAEASDILNGDFILVFLLGSLATIIVSMAGLFFFKKEGLEEYILFLMASTVGNTTYMGIPVLVGLFGARGGVAAVIGTITVNLTLTALGICALSICASNRHDGRDGGSKIKPLIRAFCTPFIIACIIGIGCSLLTIRIPAAISRSAELLGSPTAAAALFAVGLSLARLKPVKKTMLEAGWLSLCKLVFSPLLVLAFCPLFPELDPIWKSCAVLLAAMPLASNVCLISANSNRYIEESSAILFISTLLSALSLTFFTHLLMS
ncbi:AEC family transporter [Desulfotalea psychrophila]|uniref:Conserved hypothetical membrane protein n=1 Tax=Desulfotalea psychrophila (strain LSv54 / DSM 12343) TaxID=177439 RepID=Q6ANV7_DESPS|nr:AEC family transporter [Desulfotalea psychrophila]CAG35967.1 conserved hypothetical membrane protein [Desulfotalea psychrophila LSv54]